MTLAPLPLPWLELAIAVALAGALVVSRLRDPLRAYYWGLIFTGAATACALLACVGFYLCRRSEIDTTWSLLGDLIGRQPLALDELNAPLIPLVSLLHFLAALATGSTKVRRFSLAWSLALLALRLAMFSCREPWALTCFLVAGTLPGYLELLNRQRPTRVYTVHMGLFVTLLVIGWAFIDSAGAPETQPAWATVAIVAAILIRCGAFPVHCWLIDWFEHASFGIALLLVAPLTEAYAAVRLVLPVAPNWLLASASMISLATAVYAAGMAVTQREERRFFAYLFLSHASLVLLGLELHTAISLTGALALWISLALSLTGFGLTLRALEARFGRLSLTEHRGLYEHSPALAVCFLVTGLATVGFPGTLGFVAAELLVDSAVEINLSIGLAVVLAAALNGIAVVRAYFVLFTGARRVSTVSLGIGLRERIAVLTLIVLLLGGGLYPQPGTASRYRAAAEILQRRELKSPSGTINNGR